MRKSNEKLVLVLAKSAPWYRSTLRHAIPLPLRGLLGTCPPSTQPGLGVARRFPVLGGPLVDILLGKHNGNQKTENLQSRLSHTRSQHRVRDSPLPPDSSDSSAISLNSFDGVLESQRPEHEKFCTTDT